MDKMIASAMDDLEEPERELPQPVDETEVCENAKRKILENPQQILVSPREAGTLQKKGKWFLKINCSDRIGFSRKENGSFSCPTVIQ